MTDLIWKPATELAAMIARREVSCVEVLRAFLVRIETVNPKVNAICTLEAEKALEEAEIKDEALKAGLAPGPLFGLPMAIKDLANTRGMRTTSGSPLNKDFVPDFDDLFVERLRSAGAILFGKTNVPEFGAGSHTFNRVFGTTCNPYDLTRSAGGSSGGAGAALAAGMVPLADGSDLGGSLRNPGSFNNVVGFRPSPGRVPKVPASQLYEPLAVMGPMARNVADTQLLFSVMAGPDPRDPLSRSEPGPSFLGDLSLSLKGKRLAFSEDLGILPVAEDVRAVVRTAPAIFEGLGASVEAAHPDLHDAEDIFLALRSALFASRYPNFDDIKGELKDTIRWNYEQGRGMSVADLAGWQARHQALYQRGLAFFEAFDYLLMPVSQLAPFPAEIDWPREIEGHAFTNYLQWMQSCCAITLLGAPAISVPCGFTPEGLPVGLQIVGRPGDDLGVLKVAQAFESATETGLRRPDL